MKCRRCQHENPPQAKFCLECGVVYELSCVSTQGYAAPVSRIHNQPAVLDAPA